MIHITHCSSAWIEHSSYITCSVPFLILLLILTLNLLVPLSSFDSVRFFFITVLLMHAICQPRTELPRIFTVRQLLIFSIIMSCIDVIPSIWMVLLRPLSRNMRNQNNHMGLRSLFLTTFLNPMQCFCSKTVISSHVCSGMDSILFTHSQTRPQNIKTI